MLNSLIRSTFLPFALPSIGEEEIAEVVDTLRSGWLTSGPKVKRLEASFAEYVGAKHAIAVNSCTAALHLSLAALDVGNTDDVVVPTLTFCSTANVAIHLGARPRLVDVDEDFNIDLTAVKLAIAQSRAEGRRVKAIIPVHFAGQPCDMAALQALADVEGIAVVEDAAHAAGAAYRGRKIGTFGTATAFSFYTIKNMTTGEGGMVTTNDARLAARIRSLSLHGMSSDAWRRYAGTGSWYYEVEEPGFKQNMSDIQAALGIHQLRRLDEFIAARRALARLYSEAFAACPALEVPIEYADHDHAWHLYVLRLRLDRMALDRQQFIEALRALNVGTSVHFIPVHQHPYYRRTFGYAPGEFPVADALYPRILSLPLYPALDMAAARYIADCVLEIAERGRQPSSASLPAQVSGTGV
jgi:dTDP-4-amino-4,6-dideoxygalactose transaminase